MEKTKYGDSPHNSRHSPIWAYILIAVGVVWLLGQADILTGANFVVLSRVWPILLIAFGFDLLYGRRRGLSMLIGLFSVGTIVILMIIGPALGWAKGAEVITDAFSAPLEDAASAEIYLNGTIGELSVSALNDSNHLITIDTAHLGTSTFNVTGSTHKAVTLEYNWSSTINLDFFGWIGGSQDADTYTRVGLTPNIPIDLQISGSLGASEIDLSALSLSDLSIEGGVGESHVTLPQSGDPYAVRINGGVGRTTLNAENSAPFTMDANGGIGELVVDLPDNAPVRIEFHGGLGDLTAPEWLPQIDGDDNDGTWESAAYDAAADSDRYILTIDGGIGGITVR